jgi:hypothetical protein
MRTKKGAFKMTNKEVKAILSDMKKNRLYKRVINEIVQDSEDYSGNNIQVRIRARLEDVLHGLSTGIVGSMIYYKDTCHFWELYRKEIVEMFNELGIRPHDLNGYDESDPFIHDTTNKNLMAWAAYETIAGELEGALYE